LTAAATATGQQRTDLLRQVVELNMGVASALAARYRDRGISTDDLCQVAYLALVRAANGFDADRRDTDFLTYAVPTIRGELRKHFRDLGWMVRPPRRVQELQAMVQRASEELTRTLQRSPLPGDVARHLQVSESDVIEAMSADGCFTPTSLDLPRPSGEGTIGDAEGFEDPAHLAAEARAILAPLLEELSSQDQCIVRRRFYDGWTQGEIAEEIGVGQGQVSRHLTRILGSLRDKVGDLSPGCVAA
jgi:RNA polymerase sigma-B factor